MKVTLPTGVIVEADEVEIRPDGTFVMRDHKTQADRPAVSTRDDRDYAISQLTDVQRRTFRLMQNFGEAHVTAVAEELEITTGAAGQRLRSLVDFGLVECIAHGKYAIKED